MIFPMRNTTRAAKSYTLDEATVSYVARTKAEKSASERVNELLNRAIRQEREEKLEKEAAAFFAGQGRGEKLERRAFRKASLRILAKD